MSAPDHPMARLVSADGRFLELGWKPRDARQRLNSRARDELWLVVRGCAGCEQGTWSFTDQSLTEGEAADLVAWLRQEPWPKDSRLTFMEPCLAFAARGAAGGTRNLTVRFAAEAAPPWADAGASQLASFTLDIAVTPEALATFARTLASLIVVA